jgi:predicted anti-sigma-YlaC factor YlaD
MEQIDKQPCSGCLTCQEWAQLVLDQEADEAQMEYVKQHVANCPCCADCFETDKILREKIKCKCGKDLPDNLLEQIREKVLAVF